MKTYSRLHFISYCTWQYEPLTTHVVPPPPPPWCPTAPVLRSRKGNAELWSPVSVGEIELEGCCSPTRMPWLPSTPVPSQSSRWIKAMQVSLSRKDSVSYHPWPKVCGHQGPSSTLQWIGLSVSGMSRLLTGGTAEVPYCKTQDPLPGPSYLDLLLWHNNLLFVSMIVWVMHPF